MTYYAMPTISALDMIKVQRLDNNLHINIFFSLFSWISTYLLWICQ